MITELLDRLGVAPAGVLEHLFERLPVGIAVVDRDLRLRGYNAAWAEVANRHLSGTAAVAGLDMPLFELDPDAEAVLKPLFTSVFSGETVCREGIRLEGENQDLYRDVVIEPLSANGEVVAALVLSLDATERVAGLQAIEATSKALRESELNLRSLLESAQGYAIYRVAVDPENPYLGRVVLVSPSITEVIGIEDPYDFASWFAGVHPEDRSRIVQANRQSIEAGVPFDETMRFWDKRHEQWRWVHTVSVPIFDETGRLTHFNGITIDITEQKRAEATLAQLTRVLEQQVAERTREIEQRRLEEHERREESERRRQVAESLRETLGVLNSGRPLPEILDHIVTQASHLTDAAICTLHHIDYERGFVNIVASHGLPEALRDITGFPLLSSQADQRILDQEPVLTYFETLPEMDPALEASTDPGVWRWRTTLRAEHSAFLAVPLVLSGEVYGSLAFYFATPQPCNQDTIDLATAVGEQAALAIDNARLRLQAEQAAVATERNRLARELHDAVTQTLFSAGLIADVLPRIWDRDPETGQAKLAELRELTRGALAEMRTLLLELRPAALTESPLDELLKQLVAAAVGRSRLKAEVKVEGMRSLAPDVQVALYRIAQEALNNVIKHAGASQVTVALRYLPDCVELEVVDDGRGFTLGAAGHHSLGLGIMRERAANVGADLQIDSVIGEGTSVKVHICD